MRDLYQVALKALGSPREFGEGFRTPGEPWVEPWSPGRALGQPWTTLGDPWGEPWGALGAWGGPGHAVN